jgi:hypothetical protein
LVTAAGSARHGEMEKIRRLERNRRAGIFMAMKGSG